MVDSKRNPNSVDSSPLFAWFGEHPGNRAKLKAAGYSDGRITNYKNRGIPLAQVGKIAKVMNKTYEQYMELAEKDDDKKETKVDPVPSIGISPEAIEIARAFDRMQPQTRDRVREFVFIASVIDRSFPWLRTGKPVSEKYAKFEKWHEENMAAQLALEAGRITKSRK